MRRDRFVAGGISRAFVPGWTLAGLLWISISTIAFAAEPTAIARWKPSEPANQPLGVGQGIFPGRVVWIHNPEVAKWDGDTSKGGWFEDRFTDPVLAAEMLSQSLRRLTGAASDSQAWELLFRHYNRSHARGDVGYRPGEKITLKLNLNCSVTQQPDFKHGLYNTPQLTLALMRQLVNQAHVREEDITVYDASRWVNDTIYVPVHAEFPGIRFEDQDGGDGREQIEPDKTAAVHFADPSVPESGRTWLPRCVTGATYLLNVAVLKGHSLAGVTFNVKNHFGSVYRENAGPGDRYHGWNPSHLHATITSRKQPMGTYNAMVDLMGHKDLGGKTILYLIDALYASPHQSVLPERWQSAPFDGHWTASVFASQDPVAIESVGVDFFGAEPSAVQMVGAVDNYLHEAALADHPPSGSQYDPEGDGSPLGSLGVHEHWNNPVEKKYSRNLGTGQGIELVGGD